MLTLIVGDEFADVSTGLIVGATAAFLAVVVAFYVLRGLGLYKLAVRYGVKCPILAWFPFTWVYTLGLLLGDVALFGKRVDKFALCAFIVYTVFGVLHYGLQLVSYIPVVGYFLQGGTVYLSSSTEYFSGMSVFGTDIGYLGLSNFVDPYSAGFWNALNIISYIIRIIRIVTLFFLIVLYSNFFRCFLPNHYFIATVFSFFGFFGPFAFVVRNNERVNYAEYMRARYAAFYGAGNGYGGYGQRPNERDDIGDPFEETDDKSKNKGDGSDDPFDEFNNDRRN